MNCEINRPVLDLGTRWVLAKEVVTFPVLRGPDWSGNKSATAVRADVLQDVIDTRGAERALVGADARIKRVGKQRFVAVLTGRSEFKHATSLSVTANVRVEARAASCASPPTRC